MKFKKKYTVRDQVYTIRLVDMSDCGECNYEEKIISINKNLDVKEQCKTLLHELLHALFYELKYQLDDKTEHMIIYNLEYYLFDVWFNFVK